MDEDDFYALRTAYYLGDYAKVDQEYKNLSGLTGMKAKERDSYLCRSLIAQNRFKEAQRLSRGEASPIVATKQLLTFKQATSSAAKEIVMERLKEYLCEASYLENNSFCVIAAQIFVDHGLFREALELVVNRADGRDNLERLLIETQIYLQLDRPDLAQKALQKMQEMEDDDAMTQMATIALFLYHGGAQKVSDARELIEDLMAAGEATILLVDMLCVANMHARHWSEAWKLCKQARDLAKKFKAGNDKFEMSTATLINSITCLLHLNKGQEIIPKLEEQLRRIAPEHRYLKDLDDMSAMFDKSANNFKL